MNLQLSYHTSVCANGPTLRINISKLTVYTAFELVLFNGNFLGETVSVFSRPANTAFRTWIGSTVLPNGAHVWYKGDDGSWWLGKISAITTTDGVCLVRFLG